MASEGGGVAAEVYRPGPDERREPRQRENHDRVAAKACGVAEGGEG